MERCRPFLRLRGCEHLKNTVLSSSRTERRRAAASGTKHPSIHHRLPSVGRPNTELRVRLETPRLYSLNAAHSPLVTITSGVGFWNDPLGSLQMAVCHGNVHCRDSESAQTGIGSGSAGTVQASLPSLCGSRLLRPRVGVGQGESQRSPISLLSGSSHLPVFFLQEVRIKDRWM